MLFHFGFRHCGLEAKLAIAHADEDPSYGEDNHRDIDGIGNYSYLTGAPTFHLCEDKEYVGGKDYHGSGEYLGACSL